MSNAVADPTPKRVIIVVKSTRSDEEIVKAILRHLDRAEDEYERNEHFIHLDPDLKGQESWSHVILDMHASMIPNSDLRTLPHEIYKARIVGPEEDLYVNAER